MLQPSLRRNISLSKKHSTSAGKPTKHRLRNTVIVWLVLLAFTVPIFRSGVKSNMTLWEFIIIHTIFSDGPEYIPKEDYAKIFG